MKKAFTLIETIIVISIILILVGLSALALTSSQQGQDLGAARSTVIQTIREAQSNSLANLGDNPWGVHFEANRMVIFTDSGAGFVEQDKANVVRFFPKGVVCQTDFGENLIFVKGKDTLLTAATVTLSADPGSVQITINSEGMIDY